MTFQQDNRMHFALVATPQQAHPNTARVVVCNNVPTLHQNLGSEQEQPCCAHTMQLRVLLSKRCIRWCSYADKQECCCDMQACTVQVPAVAGGKILGVYLSRT